MDKVAVIGPGRMGTALTRALSTIGLDVVGACSLSPTSQTSTRFLELTRVPVRPYQEIGELVRTADIVLITTPDKAVTPVAQTLAREGCLDETKTVVHTSGMLTSRALDGVEKYGAKPLCMHPLQTIANPANSPELFHGVYFTLEGNGIAVELAKEWVQQWGAVPLEIRPEAKPAYHAAAVLASNAMVALASVAAQVSPLADGLQALLPLMRGALENLEQIGLPDALTGPIERGDSLTVEAHIQALQNNPTALSVYAALGQATARVAYDKGSLSQAEWEASQTRFQILLGGM